jgi:hypothetical protein
VLRDDWLLLVMLRWKLHGFSLLHQVFFLNGSFWWWIVKSTLKLRLLHYVVKMAVVVKGKNKNEEQHSVKT